MTRIGPPQCCFEPLPRRHAESACNGVEVGFILRTGRLCLEEQCDLWAQRADAERGIDKCSIQRLHDRRVSAEEPLLSLRLTEEKLDRLRWLIGRVGVDLVEREFKVLALQPVCRRRPPWSSATLTLKVQPSKCR